MQGGEREAINELLAMMDLIVRGEYKVINYRRDVDKINVTSFDDDEARFLEQPYSTVTIRLYHPE